MKFIREEWRDLAQRPTKSGEYELRKKGGDAVERVEYSKQGWAKDTKLFDAWRGLMMSAFKLPPDELQERFNWHRRRLARYRAGKSDTHKGAAKSALWLARRAVSLRLGPRAYRFYMIAHRLDHSSLVDVDKEWQADFHAKGNADSASREHRDDEHRKVTEFFRKRGGAPGA